MRRSLRFWLSLGLATLVAVAILLVTLVVLGALVPRLNAKVETQSRTLGKAAAAQINGFLASFSSRMSSLCDDIASRPTLEGDRLRLMVDAIAQAEKGIESLYVVDDNDRVVEAGLPIAHRALRNDQIGIDFSGRHFVRTARETRSEAWSGTYLSVRGNIVVALALPLTFPGRTPGAPATHGVLVGELNLNEVSHFARLLSGTDELLTIIVDRRGNVVGHPDAARAQHQENLKHLVPLSGPSDAQRIERFTIDSIDYLGSITPIPATGWTALVAQPAERAFAIVRSTLVALAVGCAMALVIAVFAALVASQRMMRRIGLFAAHLEAVADGNYRASIPHSGIDEIETLSQHMRRMANAVLEREDRLRRAAKVFSHATEGILIANASGTITEVNDAFTRITGFAREEVVGQTPRMFGPLPGGKRLYARMRRALARGGQWQGEIVSRKKNGETFIALCNVTAVGDAAGTPQNYVALFSDISEMKDYQRRLERIAHFDSLTELPNRVLLADRMRHAMAQSLRRGLSLAVIYLDLDGFKSINDRHGHELGDKLLVAISGAMKNALRDGDTIARIGGDEFVAVLMDLADERDCFPVLDRLLRAASSPFLIDGHNGHTLQVSASIGLTFYPEDNVDAEQLMRHADQAMYQAKQAGRNRHAVFDVAGDVAATSQSRNAEEIRTGLARGEFRLHYQPKVNMATGAVVGAEALIRWLHPERGLLLPGDFLPFVENRPICVDVGEWVINTALEQLEAWSNAGLNLPVSVNIGARQLLQGDFMDRLKEALARHQNLPTNRLELEILETSALDDIARTSELVRACRDLGIRFALDDFGTGYSSLTYLRGLPADVLKIDRSFVGGMLDDANDLAIVTGVIGFARAFNRQVIAEGVETVEHGLKLLSLGCELAQGYGIARPMPAEEFPAWTRRWKPDARWLAHDRGSTTPPPIQG